MRALAFVASQPALIERFMALTGLSPGEIRDRAQDPALLVGLLDFLLAHEPDLQSFCAAAGYDPAAAAKARETLASDRGITSA